ncbi:conserved hypothetical protein [Ricinus communis]|uniref:Uncharacterized protein n=1 Tax=Ricinus communis TaxID=3988 RepID=B9SZ44_RICCO|nr:conserved hypothetical protein [Ricinus communis]
MNIQLQVEDSKKRNKEEEDLVKDFNGPFTDKGTKRLKQQEGGNFENLKALLDTPVTNIKRLHEKINRFSLRDKRFKGLEAKMLALLHEDEDKDFKNDEGERKRSFLDLLKECDESDAGSKALRELKIKAVNLGINLSRLVVDLMFLDSVPVDYDMLVKFQVLATSLTWIFEGENSVVLRRIFDLIVTANGELRKMKESKKAQMSMAVMIEEEWFIKSRYKEELMIEEAGSQRMNQEQEGLIEDHADKPILLLLKGILCLECFWMHRGLPNSKISLKNAIPLLEAEILKCEEALKLIKDKVKDLIKIYASWFGEEVLNMKQSDEYRAMDSKIYELWSRIEESDMEKVQKKGLRNLNKKCQLRICVRGEVTSG